MWFIAARAPDEINTVSIYLQKVGLACCQIARAYGLHVIATAGSERGVELLRLNKLTSVFNHNDEGYLQQIQVYTENLHVGMAGLCLTRF